MPFLTKSGSKKIKFFSRIFGNFFVVLASGSSVSTGLLAESAVFDEIGVQKNWIFRPMFFSNFLWFLGGSPNKRETRILVLEING